MSIDAWQEDSFRVRLAGGEPGQEPDWFGLRRALEDSSEVDEANLMEAHRKRVAEMQAKIGARRGTR